MAGVVLPIGWARVFAKELYDAGLLSEGSPVALNPLMLGRAMEDSVEAGARRSGRAGIIKKSETVDSKNCTHVPEWGHLGGHRPGDPYDSFPQLTGA